MKTLLSPASCLVCIFLTAGCQDMYRDRYSTPLLNYDYKFIVTDMPAEKQLKLTLISKSKRDLCIGREDWPDNGHLETDYGSHYGVYLLVEKQIYAYKNTEVLGYCTERICYNPIKQEEKLEGFLTYADFRLPEASYAQLKELKYKPVPFWCDQ